MKGFLLAALLLSGCVAAETKQLARDQAATADADYREWDKLTADQKKEHAFDHACSSAALNYALNGVAVPPAYVVSATAGAPK